MQVQSIGSALLDAGVKLNVTLVLMTGALMIARILPVIIYSPFLGGDAVPSEVKLSLSVILAAVLFPGITDQMPKIPTAAFPFLALLLKEAFIGMSLGFVVDMVFQSAQVAGHILDSVSGASNSQLFVPQIGHQVTLFSSLKMQLAIVLFLTLNGHHLVITALGESFLTIPLYRFPQFSGGMWPFFDLLIHVFAELLKVALSIAGPAFVASFLTDLALGMINRVAPQVQVFFVSMQIKPMVVTVMTLVAIRLVALRLEGEFRHMFESLAEAIRLMA